MAGGRCELIRIPLHEVSLQAREVRIEQLLASGAHNLRPHVHDSFRETLCAEGLRACAAGPELGRVVCRRPRAARPPLRVRFRRPDATLDAPVSWTLPEALGHRLEVAAAVVVRLEAVGEVAEHHVASILALEAKVLLLSRGKGLMLPLVEVPNVGNVEMLRRELNTTLANRGVHVGIGGFLFDTLCEHARRATPALAQPATRRELPSFARGALGGRGGVSSGVVCIGCTSADASVPRAHPAASERSRRVGSASGTRGALPFGAMPVGEQRSREHRR